jgi:exodeoxyribonuclease-5
MNSTCRERLGISGTVLAVNDPVILQRPCWLGNFNMLLNGEQGMISAVGGLKRYANLTFQEVTVTFRDLDGQDRVVQSLALLDVVQSTKGLLTTSQEQMLVHQVLKDNRTYRESQRKSDDRYLSALRLRHAYALTVHKAQGGEWDYVYLHPYLSPDLRWQYTAVTRVRAKLYTYPRPNVTNFTFFG